MNPKTLLRAGSADKLAGLMAEDHVFIDSDGSESIGKANAAAGWGAYFALVPDYRITVRETFSAGRTVMLAGEAEGTFAAEGSLISENHWRVPVAWRAVIAGDRVAVWQVYVNPEPLSEILRRLRGE